MPLLNRLAAISAVALLLGGCATTRDNPDPWEGVNRKTFAFNEALDAAVLKPVATGYVKVVPAFAREGVNNFFDNLDDIGTGLNNLLQGKPAEGASDLGRFVVNSVFGVSALGRGHPIGLEKHERRLRARRWAVGMGTGRPTHDVPLLGPLDAARRPGPRGRPELVLLRMGEPEGLYWGVSWGL